MATIFTDHRRTVSIELKDWEGDHWSPDWSADFYDAGGLPVIGHQSGPVHEVSDVDYLLGYARDMIDGTGDFDTPTPGTCLFVDELDTPDD